MRFLHVILMSLLAVAMLAQDMSVESFRKLDTDMDARINYPEKDPSGRTCAIIKVVNPNTGFVFDTGTVSVVKTKQEPGEIWVYVQPGVKRIIIRHPSLGVLRDYYFPMAIEEAAVYEMRLTTGTVHTYVEQRATSAYLVITSAPDGADVYIGGEWAGTTPFNKKYGQGDRLQYRVSRALYHDEVGDVLLDKAKTEVNAQLKPAYGAISVTSQPSGASVILDNDAQPRGKTPLTIPEVPSGPHRVRVQMPRYGQQVLDLTVRDGATANAEARLTASFATVTVKSLPGASITVDGEVKGTGSATWEQDAGLCDIDVSLAGHRKQSRQIEVQPGQPQTLTLEPVPMYGVLAVESEPMGADIYIDGVKRGVTPDIFDHLLATDHSVRLSKSGCADFTTTVTLKEGSEQTLRGTLQTGGEVTITTGARGDDIYIDGQFAGKSPLTTTASYGSHKAYAVRGDKNTTEKSFDVSSGSNAPLALSFTDPTKPQEFKVNGVKFRMIPVEGGTFTMGATNKLAKGAPHDEKPTHKVVLSDFMIGETEVTQELWKAVMGENPSYFKGLKLPVEKVSWYDCKKFIKKLNSLTGLNFRLPTEAEWEYVAKGGNKASGYLYSGSNDIGSVGWTNGKKTYPVAQKKSNELGVFDMTGNVWEWCSDLYGAYSSQTQSNPVGVSESTNRVCRGGGWSDEAQNCRVSRRKSHPGYSNYDIGLRLVLEK